MKSRFIVLCILILTCSVSFGQKIPEAVGYRNAIKFTPLKLLQPINTAVELGFERNHNVRYASTLMLSYLLPPPSFFLQDDFASKTKGFRTSFQERYYLHLPKGKKKRTYLAFELDYLNNTTYKAVASNYADTTLTH